MTEKKYIDYPTFPESNFQLSWLPKTEKGGKCDNNNYNKNTTFRDNKPW